MPEANSQLAIFGLKFSDGKWQYEGRSQSATDLRSPKECAQVLRMVRSKVGFNQMCIVPERPVAIILATTPPNRVVTGFNLESVETAASLAANLALEVGGKTDSNITIVGGFVVVALP